MTMTGDQSLGKPVVDMATGRETKREFAHITVILFMLFLFLSTQLFLFVLVL